MYALSNSVNNPHLIENCGVGSIFGGTFLKVSFSLHTNFVVFAFVSRSGDGGDGGGVSGRWCCRFAISIIHIYGVFVLGKHL